MRYALVNQCSLLSNFISKKSALSNRSSFAPFLILIIALSHASVVMAEDVAKDVAHQMAQNSEAYDSKVAIDSSAMTVEMKRKSMSKDNRIGSFSIEDGAREGVYGDGSFVE